MDERHSQITEGKGLEESRVNQEFIDNLKRWGPHVLTALAVIALIYLGMQWYQRAELNRTENAFQDYNFARQSGNPEGLIRVAEQHAGRRGVPNMARLAAADILYNSYRTGLRPGSPIDPATGEPQNEEDVYTEEQREATLTRVAELYQQVLDQTQGDAWQKFFTVRALYGLAAVAEDRDNLDRARELYTRIEELSEQYGLDEETVRVVAFRESLDELAEPAMIYEREALHTPPPAPGGGAGTPANPLGLPGELRRVDPPVMPGQAEPQGPGVPDPGVPENADPLRAPSTPEATPPAEDEAPAEEQPEGDPDAGDEPAEEPSTGG